MASDTTPFAEKLSLVSVAVSYLYATPVESAARISTSKGDTTWAPFVGDTKLTVTSVHSTVDWPQLHPVSPAAAANTASPHLVMLPRAMATFSLCAAKPCPAFTYTTSTCF
ncbi:MAG: hypothetical protein AMXMBFR34_44840 [Myxococcaceae bacterium]